MASKLPLFIVLFALVWTARCASDESVKIDKKYIPTVLNNMLRIFTLNHKCLSSGFFECLRFKLLKAIDKAVRTTDILEVTHGVYFVRNPNIAAYNGSDPRALLDTHINVPSFLMGQLREFLKTHLLQVK